MIRVMIFLKTGFLFVALIGCQPPEQESHQEIDKATNEIFESLVSIKRDLHMNPELSGQEKRTSTIVANYLTDLGLEVKTDIAKNSVVGILKGGKEGRNIAWRADMDAIRIETNDTVGYHSRNEGIAHMCGHDVHTTIGLGIANVLSKQKEDLEGTIYFIFQSAEETFTGARDLINNGLFDLIEPDEIYALHIGPAEKGTINTREKELFAYKKSIQVVFESDSNDEEIENFLTEMIQGFVRNVPNGSPWSLDYLADEKLGLESEETIYKDYFILQSSGAENRDDLLVFNADFLETSAENIDSIPLIIENKVLNSPFGNSLISVKYSEGTPTVYNDPTLTQVAMQTIDSIYSEELIRPIHGQIPYFNEDFIYYQQRVPGVIFLLGGSDKESGLVAMPHSPDFSVHDEIIKIGVKCFSSLVLERAKSTVR